MDIQLFHGDCLEIMKNIPDKSVDLILCDLPYGSTASSWDIIIPFDKLWEQYERLIKDNASIILFSNGLFTAQLMTSNMNLYKYKYTWSCYEGGEKPCGKCGTCIDRAKAFELNGIKDPAME